MLIRLLATICYVCALLGCAAGLFLWGFVVGRAQGTVEVSVELREGPACLWTRLPAQEEGMRTPVLPLIPEVVQLRAWQP
jgi:hypothetical protein